MSTLKPTRANENWTTSQDTRLKKLVKEGKSASEIATELGRSVQAITNRRYVLNKKSKGSSTSSTKSKSKSEVKPTLVEDVKSIVKESGKATQKTFSSAKKSFKKTAKEVKKSFGPIGKSVNVLLKKAFKQGISVSITLNDEKQK